jgi:hypothetical protein
MVLHELFSFMNCVESAAIVVSVLPSATTSVKSAATMEASAMETASEARPPAESVAPRDASMIETTECSGMHTAGTM